MTEQKAKSLTYAGAGVDIEAGNRAVGLMKQAVRSTLRPEVLTEIGGFGGLFALNTDKYKEPVLVSGTDGVGTKLRVAQLTGVHHTIGIDAVAMCVNDILVQGAEPLFFLDYLAVGKLQPERVAEIVEGVAEGCRQAGCALIGGETAEMPGFYGEEEYDIAGFAVGVVDRSRLINGKDIAPGDVVIGLGSSGLHSNGYSLARKALLEVSGYSVTDFLPELGRTVGDELLMPTRIYVKSVQSLLEKYSIKGMAHITGGGLTENLPRILPPEVQVVLDPSTWPVLPVFKLIQKIGRVAPEEMLRTFNMGIGMVLIVPAAEAAAIMQDLASCQEQAYRIGRVESGAPQVRYESVKV
ncbi:phosphoribosylformylglycinamidine cyclo-ligase [Desulfotomaculum sp. 1211_IL3151]|uniref:phosphoribosylformylglycinamidine cyclo-ligase n=1 Tax=Desulfotomaculum sp. 1211_IL3151 TaxID=3084055 RepID=UPI002FD8A3A1